MRRAATLLFILLPLSACLGDQAHRSREAVFIGIDVSGSFRKFGLYNDSIEFLAHYIHGRLHHYGELKPMKTLFVGSIGGESLEEPKSFHPIHDFEDKSVERIEKDLRLWTSTINPITDFNAFFQQVAYIARKRKLSLTPITIILLTDGIPAVPTGDGGVRRSGFDEINMKELEYLSRKVTVRVLYATTRAAREWDKSVPRRRVRMWTVDAAVMTGWKAQLKPGLAPAKQEKLWAWVKDNVDFRVSRSSNLLGR